MLTITARTDEFSAICKESICPSVMGSDFPLAALTENWCWGEAVPESSHVEDINAFLVESDCRPFPPPAEQTTTPNTA